GPSSSWRWRSQLPCRRSCCPPDERPGRAEQYFLPPTQPSPLRSSWPATAEARGSWASSCRGASTPREPGSPRGSARDSPAPGLPPTRARRRRIAGMLLGPSLEVRDLEVHRDEDRHEGDDEQEHGGHQNQGRRGAGAFVRNLAYVSGLVHGRMDRMVNKALVP